VTQANTSDIIAPMSQVPEIMACYPDGVPEGFPVSVFMPIDGTALDIREQALRDKIDQLQDKMLEFPQPDLPLRHWFAGGVYSRELFVPKGTLLLGKVHLTDHIFILLSGDLTFVTVDGPARLVAPAIFCAPAGSKKTMYANEDAVMVTNHMALHADHEFIAAAISVDTYAEYDTLISRVAGLQEN
jgi:hypothetical protein